MTNSKALVENKVSAESKISANECDTTEKPRVKRTTDTSCNRSKQPEVQSTVNSKQVSKKPVSKSRSVKTNKKQINSNKEKQETKKRGVNEDGNRSLDQFKDWHIPESLNKSINKENEPANNSKNKIASPSHKLTEYFADLNVHDNKIDVIEEINIKKEQLKNESVSEKTALTPKQPLQTAKKKLQRKVKGNNIELTNHKVTEYFQVRRSERKYKKSIIDERQKELENKIIKKVEHGLEIKEFEGKGRGVVTTKEFYKGDFVIEYIGDLIDSNTAKEREIQYAKKNNIGCYMYYFKHKDTQYCIDATAESGKLGRLINHSRKGNLISRIIELNKKPHLVLFAKMDISVGTEILYDYGDRSRESVKHHPWLNL